MQRSQGIPEAQSPSPGVKIVRAPKSYSAAHRVSLLRHPHGGNTRSRTKTQAQTPRTNTSRTIDFGQERKRLNLHLRTDQGQPRHRFWRDTPWCNLSAIGLREGIAAKLGECQEAQSPMAKQGSAGRQATKKADKRQLFLLIIIL